MTDERRNQGDRRRRQPRRKTDRKVTTGSKLDLILDVTRRLMSITDLDALLRDMATVTTQLLDADRATIFIVDRERGEICRGLPSGLGAGEIRQAIGVGIAGLVAATGEAVNIPRRLRRPTLQPRARPADRLPHEEPADLSDDRTERAGHRRVPGRKQERRRIHRRR